MSADPKVLAWGGMMEKEEFKITERGLEYRSGADLSGVIDPGEPVIGFVPVRGGLAVAVGYSRVYRVHWTPGALMETVTMETLAML